jgi:hypothetical protein
MATGVVTGLALDAIEKAAPVIVAAMAPEVQKLFATLPANTVKVVPPAIDIEVAIAANLQHAMPAFSAEIFATVKSKIGIAVAIYATEHPDETLEDDAAWIDIQSMALTAIADEGLDPAKIPLSTLRQMVASGIELYRAGAGVRALRVSK